uniref:Uncharacterized protein n=1 Tax=Syphacia muris TaxID=451379 RepID=A0A0N5ATB0_9BILA
MSSVQQLPQLQRQQLFSNCILTENCDYRKHSVLDNIQKYADKVRHTVEGSQDRYRKLILKNWQTLLNCIAYEVEYSREEVMIKTQISVASQSN